MEYQYCMQECIDMKKLFISQPMRGKTDEEILAVREKSNQECRKTGWRTGRSY